MIAGLGLLSVVFGAVAASCGARFPGYTEAIETGAGGLLIAGFALAALALPAAV